MLEFFAARDADDRGWEDYADAPLDYARFQTGPEQKARAKALLTEVLRGL